MKQKASLAIAIVLLTFSLTGCLKTRAQLKQDPEDSKEPVPAQIQDVQPQGQYAIDEIKGEITRLTGRIEDLERKNQQAETTPTGPGKEDFKKIETRINELETAQAAIIEALKKKQSNVALPEASELFDKGKKAFQEKQFNEAIESLSGYLKNPSGKHAEEATFLRAESYYELKEYKKAIVDYSKFPEKFTRSKRMPAALLKIGRSFDALGMKEDAKGFYAELVEKFPKSSEAKKAKSKLK